VTVRRLVAPEKETLIARFGVRWSLEKAPKQEPAAYELGTDGTFLLGRTRKVKPPAPASEYEAYKECDDQSGS
jgi:hypothetical protein